MVVENREGGDASIDGILSPDVLRNFDLDFDFAAHKLNLISPEHCEAKVVYWTRDYADAEFMVVDGHIVLPMKLDGQELQATLDTGSTVSGISESASKRFFHIDRSSAEAELDPEASANSLLNRRHRFKSLTVGGLSVNNPVLY
jgi:aspartyl protease